MSIFQKFLLAGALSMAPITSHALTITESFGLEILPFGSLQADVVDDNAGVTVTFDDRDFFADENPESTFFPFGFSLQDRTGGFTRLRIQSDVCEDGSCGFRGIRPGSNFGFNLDGEDIGIELDNLIFPGDVDVDQEVIITDLMPTPDGDVFGQFFNVRFLDPFANGDQLPTFSLTFTYIPAETQPSVVPLPASGLLLLGAFGGLAWMRRKKA